MTRSKLQFRPSMEILEVRKNMAGDVAVALEGSLLRIEGDNLSNQIAVTQVANGDVIVSGQNGTLINGLPSARFVRPALNALDMKMEGGNDTVAIRGLSLTNDLSVDLGAGDDRINAIASAPVRVGGNASILGNEGSDTVQLAGLAVREDMYIDGGLGRLNLNLSSSSVDKVLSIISDEADDSIVVSEVRVGLGVTVESKAGSDIVNLRGLSALSLMVNTDANSAIGADQVTLNRVQTREDLGVFTGAGNDIVRMTDVSSQKGIQVSLDEGNDLLVATRVAAATDAVFEGGAGIDTLQNFGITAGIKREFKEFEFLR